MYKWVGTCFEWDKDRKVYKAGIYLMNQMSQNIQGKYKMWSH